MNARAHTRTYTHRWANKVIEVRHKVVLGPHICLRKQLFEPRLFPAPACQRPQRKRIHAYAYVHVCMCMCMHTRM